MSRLKMGNVNQMGNILMTEFVWFNPRQQVEFRSAVYTWPWQSVLTNVGMRCGRLRSQIYSLASTASLNFELTWPLLPLLPEPETLQRKPCHLPLAGCYWLSWGIVWATKPAQTGKNEFSVSDHSSHSSAGFSRELESKYDQHHDKFHANYL